MRRERTTMKIEGSIRANLIAALASARRLRGRPIHGDTLAYWRRLLDHAHEMSPRPQNEMLGDVMAELEIELARDNRA